MEASTLNRPRRVLQASLDISATSAHRRQALLEGLHVLVLCSFAIAQPILDLLGRNPTFFVAHRATGSDILLLALAVLFAPPLAILILLVVGFHWPRRAGGAIIPFVIGTLLGLTLLPPLARAWGLTIFTAIPTFLFIAGFGLYAYRRYGPVRSLLTWVSPAPLVFAGVFLFGTPVRQLIGPSVSTGTMVVDNAVPVVVVLFDEFALSGLLDSTGNINIDRFPAFGRLAGMSTWYPNATTVNPTSRIAVTSILTGTFPSSDAVPALNEFPANLFTLLAPRYEVRGREAITGLCPPQYCAENVPPELNQNQLLRIASDTAVIYLHTALPEDVAQRWLPPIANRWAGFLEASRSPGSVLEKAREVISAREEDVWLSHFLQSLEPSQGPRLYFLHSLLPHSPWRYLPSGQIYENDFFGGILVDAAGSAWRDDERYTHQGVQRFLLQAMYVDRFVGTLIDRLEELQLLDRSLLIVLADHGISFEPGTSRRGLDFATNAAGILPIPLFVKLPFQTAGAIDMRYAQTIDVVPTVADVLGVAPSYQMDGDSLAMPATGRAPVVLTTEGPVPNQFHLYEQSVELARANHNVFGSGAEPFDVYAMGPYRELVGTVPQPAEVAEEFPRLEALVSAIDRFRDVDPAALTVPSRVTGSLIEGRASDLALTLNGVIASVGWTYYWPEENKWAFSLFVPPALMNNGCNQLGLYEIGNGPELQPVSVQNQFDCP